MRSQICFKKVQALRSVLHNFVRLRRASKEQDTLEWTLSSRILTVASYRRRHQLAEEVPGLYIRRLTLEDPRSAREPSSSRSQSPTRHICHPTTGYVPSTRRSSSYRSWLERIRKERPPFLTIVSLELPESPIPLIESQASARSRPEETSESLESKDDILHELLEKVTATGNERDGLRHAARKEGSSRKSRGRRKRGEELVECTKGVPTLEECTKNIVEGTSHRRLSDIDPQHVTECICSEISENFRVNARKESQARESLTSSPEMSHIIRIAMNYHDRFDCDIDDEDAEETRRSRPGTNSRDARTKKMLVKEDGCCNSVNDTLDFTLNCSSLRLTSRGGTGGGKA
ncbi:uncharacterized protein LOC128895796 [Hylaeus anthracinus]|uniref:uncharacterized protein LOC128895796 n=1 Tax=Hylaeus anthracinus TaxID=313031 RepID=UPI0023B914E0|nr:uncharacterized protein LOC128895796 [Hylaeus anthracinus]